MSYVSKYAEFIFSSLFNYRRWEFVIYMANEHEQSCMFVSTVVFTSTVTDVAAVGNRQIICY